ncbi:MAG: DUF169 domain-containing protein [Alistipes sp.]|nr:DUF169 domain-containing protein [Alistipes sp.]
MTPQQFIEQFREAFGEAAPLPIAIWYDDVAVATGCRVPRCMIGAIRKVCGGEPLTLTAENVECGGGGLYTAFRPMPERVPLFVSETEHYKSTPEMVRDYIAGMGIEPAVKPFLNFVRVDKLPSWDRVEAVLFFATPDMLSGLCTWAYYDNNAADTVVAPFASGCASAITFATAENRRRGNRCFLGMFDISARPLVPRDELSFAVPMSRFSTMLSTMPDSALYQRAFAVIRRRINK